MKMLAISNQKGGVGKTTLACHLAFYAAEKKIRTLLIDFDEGDLSSIFTDETTSLEQCLVASELFKKTIKKNKKPLQSSPFLSIIPADQKILDVDDLAFNCVKNPREHLKQFQDQFDLCIFDTPPNLQWRMIAALTAANAILIPVNIDVFSFSRLEKLNTTINNIKKEINPQLEILGILPNKVNSKSVNELEAINEMESEFGSYLIKNVIFTRSPVPVALAQKKAVWKDARSGNQRISGNELKKACAEILKRLNFNS